MEGGRPSGGHAPAGHAPARNAHPGGLASSGATPRDHQEEQEEVLLVPLRGEDGGRDVADAVMHRVRRVEKTATQKMDFGDLFLKKNKKNERRGIKMQT